MAQEKTKASWADEIDELDQNESSPVTYEKEFTPKGEEDDRIESEDRPRRERRERNNRDREPREPREQREPLPFPDSAPFTAFVGNLPYNIYRDEIQKFFEERGCKVLNVRLLMNKETQKPKGFGYVIFEELEDLKKAVGLSGQELLDRPLRIDVAEARADDINKPKQQQQRDSNRGFTRVGGNNNRYNNRSTSYDSPDNSRRGDREDKERPRIELLPRSSASNEDVGSSDAYKSNKENPFGNAKPRDEKQVQERRERTQEVTSPSNEDSQDKPRDRNVRRDNNSSGRGGRRDDRGGSNNRSSGQRKYDDKKNNKESRSRDNNPRPPRPQEFKTEPKTQISRNMFEGLVEEDD